MLSFILLLGENGSFFEKQASEYNQRRHDR